MGRLRARLGGTVAIIVGLVILVLTGYIAIIRDTGANPAGSPGALRDLDAGEQVTAALAERPNERRVMLSPGKEGALKGEGLKEAGSIHGIVIAHNEAPIEGALVEALGREVEDVTALDLSGLVKRTVFATVRTGTDGRFVLKAEEGRPFTIRASAAGYASTERPLVFVGDSVSLRLELACAVNGKVLVVNEGQPIIGAWVGARVSGEVVAETTTGNGGTFRLEGLAPGRVTVIARAAEGVAEGITVVLSPGQDGWAKLELRPGYTIEGTVTDALSGTPIVGARVGWSWWLDRAVTTDAGGRYTFRGYIRDLGHNPKRNDLVAEAAGYGRVEKRVPTPVQTTIPLDFALTPARKCVGVVTDRSGVPVSGAYVAAVATRASAIGEEWESRSSSSRGDGSFIIEDLRPDLPHVLVVGKPGYATGTYPFPSNEFTSSIVDVGSVQLYAPGVIGGRVLNGDDRPMEGVRVSLKCVAATATVAVEAVPGVGNWLLEHFVGTRYRYSRAGGRFSFGALPPGTYELEVDVNSLGIGSAVRVNLDLIEAGRIDDVLLRVKREGLFVSGSVMDVEKKPVGNVPLQLRANVGGIANWSVSCRSNPDGRFVFAGLQDARYDLALVRFVHDPSGPKSDYFMPPIRDISPEESVAYDLLVTLLPATAFRGRIIDGAGNAVVDARVRVAIPEFAWMAETFTDGEGFFRSWVPEELVLDIEAIPPGHSFLTAEPELRHQMTGIHPSRSDVVIEMDID
jgi:hypothetical protein